MSRGALLMALFDSMPLFQSNIPAFPGMLASLKRMAVSALDGKWQLAANLDEVRALRPPAAGNDKCLHRVN